MEFVRDATFVRLHDVMTRLHADPDLAAVLQTIADSVVEVSGFRSTAINVYRPADDEFELAAVSGLEPEMQDQLHQRYDAPLILERQRQGERWGRFRFVSHTLELDVPDGYMTLRQEVRDEPGAWHPNDELSITLHAPDGALLGAMYVDRPTDGMLPDPTTVAAMEIFAVAAGIAIHDAQQLARQQEAAWLGGMVRGVIDHLAGPGELSTKLAAVIEQLRTELLAPAAWLDVFTEVGTPGVPPASDQRVFTLVAALDSYGETLALDAIEAGQAVVVDRGRLERDHPLLTPNQRSWLIRALETDGVTSVALAPLDNDEELAGQLVLARRNDRPWTPGETETLREIGRELGWALGRERSRERERLAEEERDRAARERRELLDSLAREISPHFTAIDTHMAELPPDDAARQAMESFWTLFQRVRRLVAFERPEHSPRPTVVDMTALISAQWTHLATLGQRRGVQVLPLDTMPGQLAWADPDELEWVVDQLVEDVVLTANPGVAVRFGLVTLNHRVVLSCQVSGADVPDDPDDDDEDDDDLPDDGADDAIGLTDLTDELAGLADDDPDPVVTGTVLDPDPQPDGVPPAPPREPARPWWQTGAQQMLARSDGRLSTREGPMGRRVVSLSLPVPHSLP